MEMVGKSSDPLCFREKFVYCLFSNIHPVKVGAAKVWHRSRKIKKKNGLSQHSFQVQFEPVTKSVLIVRT